MIRRKVVQGATKSFYEVARLIVKSGAVCWLIAP
jgi:hypothetical protein